MKLFQIFLSLTVICSTIDLLCSSSTKTGRQRASNILTRIIEQDTALKKNKALWENKKKIARDIGALAGSQLANTKKLVTKRAKIFTSSQLEQIKKRSRRDLEQYFNNIPAINALQAYPPSTQQTPDMSQKATQVQQDHAAWLAENNIDQQAFTKFVIEQNLKRHKTA